VGRVGARRAPFKGAALAVPVSRKIARKTAVTAVDLQFTWSGLGRRRQLLLKLGEQIQRSAR